MPTPPVTNSTQNPTQPLTNTIPTPNTPPVVTITNDAPPGASPKPIAPAQNKSTTTAPPRPSAMPSINEGVQQYQVSADTIKQIREHPDSISQPIVHKPADNQSSKSNPDSIGNLVTPTNIFIGLLIMVIGCLLVVVGANLLNLLA